MLTDEEIAVLTAGWPWPEEDAAEAVRLAEEEGWALDDTVHALDALAASFGERGMPVEVVRAAIEVQRGMRRHP